MTSDECQILQKVLESLDAKPATWPDKAWTYIVTWVVLVAFFFAMYRLGSRIDPSVLVIASVVIGAALAFVSFYRQGARVWRVTARHVSRDSVTRRIAELDATGEP